jgi:hypothetical protein
LGGKEIESDGWEGKEKREVRKEFGGKGEEGKGGVKGEGQGQLGWHSRVFRCRTECVV